MTNERTALNLAAAGFAAIANNPACPKEIKEFALENFHSARNAAKEVPQVPSSKPLGYTQAWLND